MINWTKYSATCGPNPSWPELGGEWTNSMGKLYGGYDYYD